MKWLALLVALAGPAAAVEPDEILDDPALETRARALSADLRCLVCRNESIDESNAELARDLRVLVRERLVAGDSDTEVMTYLVGRYGEFVRLTPDASGGNLILWLAGPVLLLGAGTVAVLYVRDRQDKPQAEDLSAEEKARLDALIRDRT